MDLALIGFTVSTLGEIFIGISVLRVHTRVRKEHRIDEAVLREIKKEKRITILGLFFVIVGYLLQIS